MFLLITMISQITLFQWVVIVYSGKPTTWRSQGNPQGNFAPYGPDVATNSVQWIYEDSVHEISGMETEESDTYSLYLTSFNNVITFSVNVKDSYGQIVTSQQTFISASVNELAGIKLRGPGPLYRGEDCGREQPRWR